MKFFSRLSTRTRVVCIAALALVILSVPAALWGNGGGQGSAIDSGGPGNTSTLQPGLSDSLQGPAGPGSGETTGPAQDGGTAASGSIPAGPLESGYYTLPSGVKILFRPSVNEDATGLWRFASTSDNYSITENAMEYYNTFFASNDEIHAFWNATENTMARLSVSAGILNVTVMQYIEGEELSAKTLFSGETISETHYDLATGEAVQE